jgi:hypothetical protein
LPKHSCEESVFIRSLGWSGIYHSPDNQLLQRPFVTLIYLTHEQQVALFVAIPNGLFLRLFKLKSFKNN